MYNLTGKFIDRNHGLMYRHTGTSSDNGAQFFDFPGSNKSILPWASYHNETTVFSDYFNTCSTLHTIINSMHYYIIILDISVGNITHTQCTKPHERNDIIHNQVKMSQVFLRFEQRRVGGTKAITFSWEKNVASIARRRMIYALATEKGTEKKMM